MSNTCGLPKMVMQDQLNTLGSEDQSGKFLGEIYQFLSIIRKDIGEFGALLNILDQCKSERETGSTFTRLIDKAEMDGEYILKYLVQDVANNLYSSLTFLKQSWDLLTDAKKKGLVDDVVDEQSPNDKIALREVDIIALAMHTFVGPTSEKENSVRVTEDPLEFIRVCHQFGDKFKGSYTNLQDQANALSVIIEGGNKILQMKLLDLSYVFKQRLVAMVIQRIVSANEKIGDLYYLTEGFLNVLEE